MGVAGDDLVSKPTWATPRAHSKASAATAAPTDPILFTFLLDVNRRQMLPESSFVSSLCVGIISPRASIRTDHNPGTGRSARVARVGIGLRKADFKCENGLISLGN
jgi:hypothetical protein